MKLLRKSFLELKNIIYQNQNSTNQSNIKQAFMIHHHHWLQEDPFQSESYKNDFVILLVDFDHMVRPRDVFLYLDISPNSIHKRRC